MCETFKRFYWSGSTAKFTGVQWYGDTSWPVATHYHADVVNAFKTAPVLASYINGLQGEVNVVAFSLGNMLVSSAIQDCQAHTTRYFMLHAAVAKEAYDATEYDPGMIHVDWRTLPDNSVFPSQLYASKWHNLFNDPSDGRSQLQWTGRFANVASANTYNYFSSGENVLAELNTGWITPVVLAKAALGGRYAWTGQELYKGRYADYIGGSNYGGWGFNYFYCNLLYLPNFSVILNTLANTPDQFKTQPCFIPGPDIADTLLGSLDTTFLYYQPNDPSGLGSTFAKLNKHQLLAEMIPALSYATGSHRLSILEDDGNFDMNLLFQNGWPAVRGSPQSWFHGDYKTVAYVYVYRVFDDINAKGNLDQ